MDTTEEDTEFQELLEDVRYSIDEIKPDDAQASIYKIKEILSKLVGIIESNVESRDEVEQEIEESEEDREQ